MYQLSSILEYYAALKQRRREALLKEGKILPLPRNPDCMAIFNSYQSLVTDPSIALPGYKFKCGHCLRIGSLTDTFNRTTSERCCFKCGKYDFCYEIDSLPTYLTEESKDRVRYRLDPVYLKMVISDLISESDPSNPVGLLGIFICGNNSYTLSIPTKPIDPATLDVLYQQHKLVFHTGDWSDFSQCTAEFNVGNKLVMIEPLFYRLPIYPSIRYANGSESGGFIPDYLLYLIGEYKKGKMGGKELARYWDREQIEPMKVMKIDDISKLKRKVQ